MRISIRVDGSPGAEVALNDVAARKWRKRTEAALNRNSREMRRQSEACLPSNTTT